MAYFTIKQYRDFLNEQIPGGPQRRRTARAFLAWDPAQAANTYEMSERASGAPISVAEATAAWRKAHKFLAERNTSTLWNFGLSKWLRPWDVVPALRNITAPEGDYTIGFEVEMGFVSPQAASQIAKKIIGWKNVTLDVEGGTHPIEATFPPILASKFNDRSQAVRYIKILSENSRLLYHRGQAVGTHVNVGCASFYDKTRRGQRIEQVNACLRGFSTALQTRYFGRAPYGYGYVQGGGRWVEWKLFDSTSDVKKFKMYAQVALALTKLACSNERITMDTVVVTCERAYRKMYPKRALRQGVDLPYNISPDTVDLLRS